MFCTASSLINLQSLDFWQHSLTAFRTSNGRPAPTIAFTKYESYLSSQEVKLDNIAVHSKSQQMPCRSWVEPEQHQEPVDVQAPQLGPYFCYGTLMNPSLLLETLGLADIPRLRLAKLVS